MKLLAWRATICINIWAKWWGRWCVKQADLMYQLTCILCLLLLSTQGKLANKCGRLVLNFHHWAATSPPTLVSFRIGWLPHAELTVLAFFVGIFIVYLMVGVDNNVPQLLRLDKWTYSILCVRPTTHMISILFSANRMVDLPSNQQTSIGRDKAYKCSSQTRKTIQLNKHIPCERTCFDTRNVAC